MFKTQSVNFLMKTTMGLGLIGFNFNGLAQNLIQNGDFESGGPGTGFIIDGVGYTQLNPPFSGITNDGNFARATNSIDFNNTFISHGDHTSGAGFMMVFDGNTVGGQQRFYKAGNTGGGVCGLQVGQTYTFSYWIRSISANSNSVGTRANIGIQINNASAVTMTAGSTLAPVPNAGWVQVIYTFTPTNACVNIEMFNNNTSSVGNNFAIDDVSLTAPPSVLQLTYSIVNSGCGSATNFLAAYGKNGTAPYTFTLSGAGNFTNSTGIFNNLPNGTYTLELEDAVGNVQSINNILIDGDFGGSILTNDLTICVGETANLQTAFPAPISSWSSAPNDPSIQVVNPTTVSVSPAVSTIYTLTGSPNLIDNHSFQQGNAHFFSNYQLAGQNPSGSQGVAGVTANSNAFFNPFAACTDQDGTNSMLVADGATQTGPLAAVWRQTVPVTPNTPYVFSYWATSVATIAPAQLQVLINGTPVNSTQLPTNTCNWQNILVNWNSGAASLATIEIRSLSIAVQGNDFAIDNLSFQTNVDCEVTVTVTNGTALNLDPNFEFCAGETLVLSVPGATNLTWTLPDNSVVNSDILTIPNVQANAAGVYTVASQGTNCTSTATTTVTISGGPDISFTGSTVSCGNYPSADVTGVATGVGPFQFSWSNGVTTALNEDLGAGNYTLEVTDADGCVNSETLVVTAQPEVEAIIDVVPSDCGLPNGEVYVTLTGGDGNYATEWSFGGTGTSFSGLSAGSYDITVTSAGCEVVFPFTIQSTNGFTLDLISTQDVSCFGLTDGSIEVAAAGNGAPFIFTWTPNVSNSEIAGNLSAGVYQVMVENQDGCLDSLSVQINEPDELILNLNIDNPSCGTSDGTIIASADGGILPYTFSWDPAVGNGTTATDLAPGTYSVTVTDFSGCTADTTLELFSEGVLPVQVNSNTLVVQQPGDSTNLAVYVGAGVTNYTVNWFPSETLSCSDCEFPTAGPSETTTYIVTVTTPDGCVGTSSILVYVGVPCGNLFIPSIFSPNGDGLNDQFCILGNCVESVELVIYNRWGEEVFRTNDTENCWTGKFRGKDAPLGVYAYKFIATESNGKVTIESGNITLTR